MKKQKYSEFNEHDRKLLLNYDKQFATTWQDIVMIVMGIFCIIIELILIGVIKI